MGQQTQPRPKSEGSELKAGTQVGAPVDAKESVTSTGDVTGEKVAGGEPPPSPIGPTTSPTSVTRGGAFSGRTGEQAVEVTGEQQSTGPSTPATRGGPYSGPTGEQAVETTGETAEEAALRAQREQSEEFRRYEETKRTSLAAQSRKGEVSVELATQEAERAAQLTRDRQRAKRSAGVYVRSRVKLADENGMGRECPEGMRLTDGMVRILGDDQVRKLEQQGILDDLR